MKEKCFLVVSMIILGAWAPLYCAQRGNRHAAHGHDGNRGYEQACYKALCNGDGKMRVSDINGKESDPVSFYVPTEDPGWGKYLNERFKRYVSVKDLPPEMLAQLFRAFNWGVAVSYPLGYLHGCQTTVNQLERQNLLRGHSVSEEEYDDRQDEEDSNELPRIQRQADRWRSRGFSPRGRSNQPVYHTWRHWLESNPWYLAGGTAVIGFAAGWWWRNRSQ